MFTDMVGYTAMAQKNEALAVELLEEHRNLLRPIFRKHKGREIDNPGDAFLVEFASALDAVRCSVEIQSALKETNTTRTNERKILLRIGIHLGDVIHKGETVRGDAVNVASRIEPLAVPGGVCLTGEVYRSVVNKIQCNFVSMGNPSLKNVTTPIEVYRISELGVGPAVQFPQRADLPKNRIAVLPFTNMSPDPADGYFADGMTEELIKSLSGVKELSVIARTSVMKYKASTKGASEIGNELRAGTLIEGSVRKAGDRVRVTIQLIDARKEDHIWAQSYDKQLDDVFSIQSDIAERVANELKFKLLKTEKQELERKPTKSPEAYTFYLKGKYFWNERIEESVRKAIEYFNHAIKIDPDFALSYAALADCYSVMAYNYQAEPVPTYRMAKYQAQKALELDQGLGEAHAALAHVLASCDHDFALAEAEYKQAIELSPSHATAHQAYHHLLLFQRRFGEAEAEISKALDLDPLSPVMNLVTSWSLYCRKEFESALDQWNRLREIDPVFAKVWVGNWMVIPPYVQLGRLDDAVREMETLEKEGEGTLRAPHSPMLVRGYVYAALGKAQESRKLLNEAGEYQRLERLSPFLFARAYLLMGENEDAFRWLKRGYEELEGLFFFPTDFELEKAKADPSYNQTLKEMGLDQILMRS